MIPAIRLAFLADIHGNLPALETVVADLAQQAPDAVYLLGDLVNRCPWNNEVMALLAEEGWPSIQGNHDLVLGNLNTPQNRPPFTDRQRFPLIWWTWEHLDRRYVERLRELPQELHVRIPGTPPLHLFHGVPGNPFVGILPETKAGKIEEALAPVPQGVVLCGHTHRPLDRQIGGRRLFNPGSVGMPYNGDPRAHYLLLDLVHHGDGPQWRPCFRRLRYSLSGVAAAYKASGMLDEAGPLVELYLRTVLQGEPWASDFGHWVKDQPLALRQDPEQAVQLYLDEHGPGHWAFFANVD